MTMHLWEIDTYKPNENPNSWTYSIYRYVNSEKKHLTKEGAWTESLYYFAYFETEQKAIDFAINKIGPQEVSVILLELIRQYGHCMYSEGYSQGKGLSFGNEKSEKTLDKIEAILKEQS